MSFFTDASFVMDPNVYGVGKLYVPKPTDGSGDLTFSRASTGTRVNQNGLIEKVRTNQALWSEDFTNWLKTNATITANSVANPLDGLITADTFTPINTSATNRVRSSSISLVSAGCSVYVKANGYSKVGIREDITTGNYASYDLSTGTVLDSSGVISPTITALANGWYRISLGVTATPVGMGVWILEPTYTSGVFSTSNWTADGTSGIYIYGAQIEAGDVATDYIPTTTSAVSVGPLANIPRLNYGSDGCPSLLLEPQRTNFATWSEAFSNWGVSAGTITSNATTSPDGYANADLFTEDTSTGYHRFVNSCTGATGSSKTFSVYVKWAGGTGRKWLTIDNGPIAWFDIENGVTGSASGSVQTSIQSVGNGWYRCIYYNPASSVGTFFIGSANVNGGGGNHLGNGQPAFYAWGAQCEASASYASSYIPTLSTSVTRLADAASKTGISSVIGQTEGTIFLDFDFTNISGVQVVFSIHDSANNKRLELWANNSTLNGFIGGSVNITVGSSSITNGRHKVALAYKQSGDHAFYIDGVQIGTNSTAYTIAALTALSFDYWGTGFPTTAGIQQALLFKTRLSNADLARLTSL